VAKYFRAKIFDIRRTSLIFIIHNVNDITPYILRRRVIEHRIIQSDATDRLYGVRPRSVAAVFFPDDTIILCRTRTPRAHVIASAMWVPRAESDSRARPFHRQNGIAGYRVLTSRARVRDNNKSRRTYMGRHYVIIIIINCIGTYNVHIYIYI